MALKSAHARACPLDGVDLLVLDTLSRDNTVWYGADAPTPAAPAAKQLRPDNSLPPSSASAGNRTTMRWVCDLPPASTTLALHANGSDLGSLAQPNGGLIDTISARRPDTLPSDMSSASIVAIGGDRCDPHIVAIVVTTPDAGFVAKPN